MGKRKERLENLTSRATKQWGGWSQFEMALEEMGELVMAIQKVKRYGLENKKRFYNLCEEIADVEICLDSLKGVVGRQVCEDKFKSKMKRLERRVEALEKEKK